MNICRIRLWIAAVRLPRQLDASGGQSIRMNSVVAHKWHSIASAHNQKSIDRIRWPQLMTAKINESLVAYISSSRIVHLHKRDIKYEEKNDDTETKPEKKASDERSVEQRAKSEPKNTTEPDEKEAAESHAAPTTVISSDDLSATDPEKKLGLFARFKLMSKQYWYVLLPVHCVTSSVWFGGLYYLSSR